MCWNTPNTYFALNFMKIKNRNYIGCSLIYLSFLLLFSNFPVLKTSSDITVNNYCWVKNYTSVAMDVVFLFFILHKLVHIYLEFGLLCEISFTQQMIIHSFNKHLYPLQRPFSWRRINTWGYIKYKEHHSLVRSSVLWLLFPLVSVPFLFPLPSHHWSGISIVS